MDADVARSLALGSACAAFVAVPNLGALLGGGEQTGRYDTVITPPDYAFAVWAPLFAAAVADTVRQCREREAESSRRTGWPLAGAYALNTAWSLAAQTDRFRWTPLLLPAATGATAVAFRRLQRSPARSTAVAAGGLLGWTALASTVNVAAGALLAGAGKASPSTVRASAAGLAAASAALAAAAARSRHGAVPLAATAGWGLATLAGSRGRPAPVRAVAATGAVALAGAARRAAAR